MSIENEQNEEQQEASQDQSDADFDAAFDEFSDGNYESDGSDEADDADEAEQEEDGGDGFSPPRDESGRFAPKDKAPENKNDEQVANEEQAPSLSAEDQLAQLQNEVKDWQHRYNSDLGRQSALQRKIQEQDAELKRIREGGQTTQSDPGKSSPKLQALAEDFPEIAEALSEVNAAHQHEINSLKSQFQPIQQQNQELGIQREFQSLEQEHPDYKDFVYNPAAPIDQWPEKARQLINWVGQQPRQIQELMDSDSAADNAYLLKMFKRDSGMGEDTQKNEETDSLRNRRERTLRQAQSVPNRQGRKKDNGAPEDDLDAAFEYFANH